MTLIVLYAQCWEACPIAIPPLSPLAGRLQVICVEDGMPEWICEICVCRPTVRDAIEFVKQVEKDITFPIKPLK